MKPIKIDVVLDYKKHADALAAELKKSGKVSVSLDYAAEVSKLKSAVSNIPVTLSFDDAIARFRDKFHEVVSNAPISFAWDKTLEGLKSALKSISNAPIELKLQYESQLERLRSEVVKAFADISVEGEFFNVNPAKIVEKIQKTIDDPERGLQMFNDQSRFNRAKLVKYIQRLTREMDLITSNSQYALHIPADFGDINKKLQDSMPSLEAGVLVPSVPIDIPGFFV